MQLTLHQLSVFTQTHVIAHLTSCVGGAIPPPYKFAFFSLALSVFCTAKVSPLTFDTPTKVPEGSKITCPPSVLRDRAQPCNATPNRKQKILY